jgi:uncharacterized membrane protein YbhN (UPF0104 family)
VAERAWGKWAVRVAAALAAVALLTFWLPTEDLLEAASSVSPWAWVASIVGFLALHVLGASKWFILMGAAGADIRFADAVRSHLAGLFGNLFLPSVIGGDALRVGTAVGRAGKPEGVVSATVVDRALDMAVLGLLAAISGALASAEGQGGLREAGLLLGLLSIGLVVAWITLGVLSKRWDESKPGGRFVRKLRMASLELAGRPGAVALAGAGTILVQSGLVIIAWRIGLACGIDVGLAVWAFGWTLGKVAAVLPLTQGGIGVREAALASVLAPFGVPAAQSVAAGLVFECVIIAGGLIGGAISWLGRPSVTSP